MNGLLNVINNYKINNNIYHYVAPFYILLSLKD